MPEIKTTISQILYGFSTSKGDTSTIVLLGNTGRTMAVITANLSVA